MSLRDYIVSGAPVAKRRGDSPKGHRCDPLCEQIIRAYQEDQLSLVATSARTGASVGTIRGTLTRHGITCRPQGHPRGFTVLWKDQAIQLHKEGQTLREIGAVIGVTRERVRMVLNQSGIQTRLPRRHRCNEACRVALAASPPISVTRLARQAAITWARLQWAVWIHQIPTSRGHHVCTERCATIRDLLAAGTSFSRIETLLNISGISQRFPTYHPEWNWSRKKTAPAEGLSVSPQTFRAGRP